MTREELAELLRDDWLKWAGDGHGVYWDFAAAAILARYDFVEKQPEGHGATCPGALKPYAKHLTGCGIFDGKACDCGLLRLFG